MLDDKAFPRRFTNLMICAIGIALMYMAYAFLNITDLKSHIYNSSFANWRLHDINASEDLIFPAVKSSTRGSLLDRLSEFENTRVKNNATRFRPSTRYIIRGAFAKTNSISVNPSHRRKVILEWTSFFGYRRYSANIGNGCPVICDITTDRANISSSDAIIFHSRDMSKSDFPIARLPHQIFVLFGMESPFNFGIKPSDFNGVFNLTATYRQDADIRIQYGSVNQLNTTLTESQLRIFLDNMLESKTKLVLVRISNCAAQSNRLDYIRELQKYISVDFFGACGDKPCPRSKYCDQDLPKQYKFYLAFESSNCRDYITEKFWNPLLHYNAIPIVMGGSSINDYYAVAPAHSFLHVDQFHGPQQLAAYLKMLDKNDRLFEEYFLWHAHSQVDGSSNFCQLCVALNNESLGYQYYADLHGWFKEDICP